MSEKNWKRPIRISWWNFHTNKVDRTILREMYREIRSESGSRVTARDHCILFCLEHFRNDLIVPKGGSQ